MKRWAITRERGMRHFIIFYGVLGWGLTTAVLWLVFMKFFGHGFNFVIGAMIAIVVFPLGGIAWGWFVWRSSEKVYAKFLDKGAA